MEFKIGDLVQHKLRLVRHVLSPSGKAIGLVLKIKDGKFAMVYETDGEQYWCHVRELVKVQDG